MKPADFLQTLTDFTTEATPEQRLFYQVIHRAILDTVGNLDHLWEDFQKKRIQPHTRFYLSALETNQENFRDAYQWLVSDSEEKGSFLYYADHSGLSDAAIETIRKAAHKARDQFSRRFKILYALGKPHCTQLPFPWLTDV